MKQTNSIKFILTLIFIICITMPVAIIIYIVPSYYKQQTIKETDILITNNLESISDNIITYLSELQKLTTLPYLDKDVMNALLLKVNSHNQEINIQSDQIVNNILPNYLRMLRKEILSIIIINENKSILYSNRNQNVDLKKNYDFYNKNWYKKAIAANGKAVYVGSHRPDYFTYSSGLQVFSMARMIKHPYIDKPLGVIIVDANTEIFQDMFNNLKFNVGSISLLLDTNSNILYSSGKIPEKVLTQIRNNTEKINDNNNNYNVIYKNMVPAKWKIAILVSDKEMKAKIKLIYFIGILASVITIIFTYWIFQFMTKYYIVRPIREMSQVMKEVEKGNMNVRFKARGNNEISNLGNNLNIMIKKLNKLIIKDYKLVLSQKNAEYQALQSQIQPHFLYNTLNGFLGLNRLGKRKLLEKSILNLTGMLRYTLTRSDSNYTTIENEFQFIKRYCILQKMRFEEKMEVVIDYDDDVKNIRIPKLLIQPLVENAVIYGVQPMTTKCTIMISAKKEIYDNKPYLIIKVEDNGMGFEKENKINTGIGIPNVKERLKMSFFESTFCINSKKGKGTSVIIKIPINYADKEEK